MQIKQDLVCWLEALIPSEINQLNEKKPSLKYTLLFPSRDTRTGSQRDDGVINARQPADSMRERLRHKVLGTIYGPLVRRGTRQGELACADLGPCTELGPTPCLQGPEHPGLSAAHGHQGPAPRAGPALALPGCRTPPLCAAGPRAAPAPGSEELCSWQWGRGWGWRDCRGEEDKLTRNSGVRHHLWHHCLRCTQPQDA